MQDCSPGIAGEEVGGITIPVHPHVSSHKDTQALAHTHILVLTSQTHTCVVHGVALHLHTKTNRHMHVQSHTHIHKNTNTHTWIMQVGATEAGSLQILEWVRLRCCDIAAWMQSSVWRQRSYGVFLRACLVCVHVCVCVCLVCVRACFVCVNV